MRGVISKRRGMGIVEHDTDILIVGAGLAGLQAAVTISETDPNLRVTLTDLGGGASSEIMGFCVPLTSGDSPEAFANDTLEVGGGENDSELVQCLTREAIPTLESLKRLGIKFDSVANGSYDLLRSVGSSYPRVVHHGTTSGKAIIAKYREILSKNPNVTFAKSRIIKLFISNERITGALGFKNGEPVAYRTGRIILATGGASGLFAFSSWTKILRGSGYALALDAGAELTGMHRVQFEPCVTVFPEKLYGFPIISTLLFEGARLLDRNMQAITSDVPPKRELAKLIAGTVANGNGCKHGGVWFDFSGVNEAIFQRKYPEYYRRLRPLDDTFNNLQIEVKPAAHTTLGGVKIDVDGTTSIHGLFAAGEVAGGIHGRDRIGGNAGLEVLVFGRIAGLSAVKKDKLTVEKNKGAKDFIELCRTCLNKITVGEARVDSYLAKLGEILDATSGFSRSEEKLVAGIKRLHELDSEFVAYPPGSIEEVMMCANAFIVAKCIISHNTNSKMP